MAIAFSYLHNMILTYISWAVLLYGFYLLYDNYESLPEQVPIKYNFDGSVQDEGPKNTLYLLVGVGFMTAMLMTVLLFVDESAEASTILEVTHLVTQLLFTYIIYQTIRVANGEAKGLGKEFYVLMVSAVTIPLILAFVY